MLQYRVKCSSFSVCKHWLTLCMPFSSDFILKKTKIVDAYLHPKPFQFFPIYAAL